MLASTIFIVYSTMEFLHSFKNIQIATVAVEKN